LHRARACYELESRSLRSLGYDYIETLPSDVTDAEWQFVVPYLCLLPEDAGQREHPLRDVFDGLRYIVRSGSPWRYLP